MKQLCLRVATVVFTSFCIFNASLAVASKYILYFNSEPGDYIGQGEQVWLTDADVTFSASKNSDNGVRVSMVNFQATPSVWWYADFAASYSANLDVGAYENATRFPFQADSEPGLSFSGQGRGCNQLTGRFDVREIAYGTGNEVVSFAVDFEQQCDGAVPALYGSIRFNSDVPVPMLIPGTIKIENPLNNDLCVEAEGPYGATVIVTGTSVQDTGQLIYEWTTAGGDIAVGETFEFPVELNASVDVNLTITDTLTGETATSSKKVCVSDTQPPSIAILRPLEGSVVKINRIVLKVQVTDSVDQDIRTYDFFLGQKGTIELVDGYSRHRFYRPSERYETSIVVEATDSSGNVGNASVDVTVSRGRRH